MTEPTKQAVGFVGAALLTAYQLPQLARIIRRKSAADFSIPAYCMVIGGLACYAVSTYGGPGFPSACISACNSVVMLATILYYRYGAPDDGR